MDALLGFVGDGYTLIAADTNVGRSIVLMKVLHDIAWEKHESNGINDSKP